MTSPLIGIDLGTTNSLCSIFENGVPRLLKNASGSYLTPSVVGILDNGIAVVGSAALELKVTKPGDCVSSFKRWMGLNRETELKGKTYSAVELSALVLRCLKMDAETELSTEVDEAVITVPAYFNDHQRQATKLAGELAGLKVRRIINEPTAAALSYGFHDRDASKKILVFDLGGGTLDVTLMEIFEGTLEIIATAGESLLGGEDFTEKLITKVLKSQGLFLEMLELSEPLRLSRLRSECEEAKKKLQIEKTVNIRMPGPNGHFDEVVTSIEIDRSEFSDLVADLVKRLSLPLNKVLRDGETAKQDIDDIILVGGATRMPLVTELIEKTFKKKPLEKYNPDEVVALGACIQAALIKDDVAVDDIIMTDVCPYTLGVGMAKQFGNQYKSGYFSPVIHRNTTVPVSREESFFTISPNQTAVLFKVYQGEARKVKNNLYLGELEVKGIPPGPSGTEVRVRFTYDLNGILEIEAYVEGSSKRFQTVLTNHVKDLSEDEMQKAIKKLQKLKFYPRDDILNLELLYFAEKKVGETGIYQREELEELIDLYEHSLGNGDKEEFETIKDTLLIQLSQLGFEFEAKKNGEENA
jgi:molecular chaperone HscC